MTEAERQALIKRHRFLVRAACTCDGKAFDAIHQEIVRIEAQLKSEEK